MQHDSLPVVLPVDDNFAEIGAVADAFAGETIFSDYQARRSPNTLRRQRADLELFCKFLSDAKLKKSAELLYSAPISWAGMTAGLVKGFVQWQLQQGYSIASINSRLATVKTYCKLAMDAGCLEADQLARITLVKGYRQKEGRNIDRERTVSRIGAKKAEHTLLTHEQAVQLSNQPATRIGRRDRAMVALFLDLGLRCGELRDLEVAHLDLVAGVLTFYREKVDEVQSHKLGSEAFLAVMNYLPDIVGCRYLFPGQRHRDTGEELPLDERSINDRIRILGTRIGLPTLSPHDLRHDWATDLSRSGTDLKTLQQAGGWSSPYMAMRYITASEIANQGVKRSSEREQMRKRI